MERQGVKLFMQCLVSALYYPSSLQKVEYSLKYVVCRMLMYPVQHAVLLYLTVLEVVPPIHPRKHTLCLCGSQALQQVLLTS